MPASKILGRIDQIDGNILRGWVFDPSRPAKRLGVDVFVRGALFGQTTAGFARPDLAAAGFGDGRLQFLMPMASLPADALDDVTVTLTQHPEIELTLSGVRRREGASSARSLADVVAFLEPLLRHLSDPGPKMWHGRSRHPRLLSTEWVAGVPLSAFARHIRAKHNRADRSSPDDIEAFLDWFVCDYGVAQAPRRIPWSEEEIAFWRGPAGNAHSSVCRAAERFSPRAPKWSRRDAAYAWAIEDSHRLHVEDIFVDPALVADLRAVPFGYGRSAFPLSRFMHRFLKENARLHGLSARTEAQRRIVYAVIMLYGLVSPHLLAYLPSAWLAAMLDDEGRLFNEALAAMGMRTSATAVAFVDALRSRGYDVLAQAWLWREDGTASPRQPLSHDLQLIGPLGYTLGLGESARRVAAALMRCGVTLNLVDHDLGNASPKQNVALPLGAVSSARITILHLNLEEIPEALAFLPDVVSHSYLIALPYLELSAPAAAHRLGLDCVQEVWAASSFVQAICAKVCEQTHSIAMVADTRKGEPADTGLAATLKTLGVSAASIVFFVTADSLSSLHRKNLLGTIEAFQAAFPTEDNVRLLIKTHNRQAASAPLEVDAWTGIRDRVAGDRRLAILDRTLDPASYRALLASVDCLVSLHRAEGLGLDILDAMGMGIPVVATAYSGNLDFCDSRVCWPVGFRLVPVAPGLYPFAESGHVWAEPNLDEAAKALRQVYGDAAERTARTQRAVAFIAGRYGPQAFVDRINRRLKGLGLAVDAVDRESSLRL